MEKIRIFSKKAFALGPGATRGTDKIDSFITVPLSFQDMPAVYADDPTFKLAVSTGSIEIVGERKSFPAQSASVDTSFEDESVDGDTEKEAIDEKEFYEKLKAMGADEVKELADEYGAEFVESDKLKENKKRVFEAFKLKNDQ